MKYLVIAFILALTNGSMTAEDPRIIHEMIEENVVQTAAQDPNLQLFVLAVQAAGLENVLSGPGPFTIFAPNNEAFNKMGKEQFADLLKPENKEKLRKMLLYYTVPGKIFQNDLITTTLPTAHGKNLTITVVGSKIQVDDAELVSGDIQATNGVIHMINKVLIP